MNALASRLSLLVAATTLVACGVDPTDDGSDSYGTRQDEAKSTTTTSPGKSKKGGGTASSTPAPEPVTTYALNTTDARSADPIFQSSYSIFQTMDLYLAFDVTGALPGHHVASVYLVMPSGSIYQRLDVSFATDVAAWVDEGEQQAEKTATGWRVWARVPVAGTVIQQSRLVGTWSAEAWLDATNTVTAATTFAMN